MDTVKLQAPEGTSAVTVEGVPYKVEDGIVEVHPAHADILVESHGFTLPGVAKKIETAVVAKVEMAEQQLKEMEDRFNVAWDELQGKHDELKAQVEALTAERDALTEQLATVTAERDANVKNPTPEEIAALTINQIRGLLTYKGAETPEGKPKQFYIDAAVDFFKPKE